MAHKHQVRPHHAAWPSSLATALPRDCLSGNEPLDAASSARPAPESTARRGRQAPAVIEGRTGGTADVRSRNGHAYGPVAAICCCAPASAPRSAWTWWPLASPVALVTALVTAGATVSAESRG